jgi:DNA-binding NarL/FixJ family response regulator
VPDVLLAAAQALRTRRGATTCVRLLGGDGTWRQLRLSVTLLRQDGRLLAGFALDPAPAILPRPDLSDRQAAIIDRLLAGARVSTIARDLHLSQGTVRNHLVALFRRYGVHSQAELVEALRRSA